MSTRASAGRYARALLDVVIKEGNPELVAEELTTLAGLFAGNQELQKALTNPTVPVAAKRKIVESLVERAKPSAPLGKLLLLLADRDRLALIAELAEVYRERLMEHQQVIRAEVTTAVPLSDDRLSQLQQRIAAATGRRVTMTAAVDSSIIGGAVARVGSTVYDGSIATQLSKIRERLEER
jgi:F-type H+-transporting ATPase subunit delta